MSKTKTAAALVAFLLVAGLIGCRTFRSLNVPGQPDGIRFGMADFRDGIYYPVVALLHGVNPYDVAAYKASFPVHNSFPLYSPITLLLHLPFGLLPYEASEAVYFVLVLGLVLLFSSAILIYCRIDARPERVLGLATLMLASRPGYSNLALGQCSAQAALLTATAIHFARSRPAMSGLALGLATFKPTYGVALGVLMLFRRDYRAVAIGILVALIGAVLPTATILSSGHGLGLFPHQLMENYRAFQADPTADPITSLIRVDAYSVFAKIIDKGGHPGLEPAMTVAMLLVAGWIVRKATRHALDDQADGYSGVVICLVLMVSVYRQSYDLLLLWLPLVAVAAGARSEWTTVSRMLRWAVVMAMALPLANYLATYFAIGRLGINGSTWTALASANGLSLLMALATAMLLIVTRSSSHDPKTAVRRESRSPAQG